MANNIFDRINKVSKQTISAAVITDSKGRACGRVLVRFTDSQVGYNHEVAVIFHEGETSIDAGTSSKGSCYSNPSTLVKKLQAENLKPLQHSGKPIEGCGDYLSQFTDVCGFKMGRKRFDILWAI